MATHKTPEEVRHEHEMALGESLAPVYHALYNDFFSLQVKWQEYRELYATSESRIGILNAAAGGFFGLLEDHTVG